MSSQAPGPSGEPVLPRPRGRPVGSRTRVLRPVLALGAHHFAFLRATFQGLDTRSAWRRYLTFSEDESPDLRRLEQRRQAMLADLVALAAGFGRQQSADHPVNQARSLLAGLMQRTSAGAPADPSPPSALAPVSRALPSLDEFIEASGLDPDTYSQAEWLALYREQHDLHEPAAPRPAATMVQEPPMEARDRRTIAERVRALGVLEQVVGRIPQPQDALSLWLAAPTCNRLHARGWQRLEDLSRAVQVDGAGWWQAVPGLGRVRAQAIERWLTDLHRSWQRPFPALPFDPRQRARQRWLGRAAATASTSEAGAAAGGNSAAKSPPAIPGAWRAPTAGGATGSPPRASARAPGPGPDEAAAPAAAAALRWPSVLADLPAGRPVDLPIDPTSEPGQGRPVAATQQAAPGGFDADARARIQAWLSEHQAAHATWRAYRKEAERLWWWCGLVRQCGFSALTAADLQAFAGFLQAPPSSWLCATPLPRTDPGWRPFRAALSARSAGHALRVVRSLLGAQYPEVASRLAEADWRADAATAPHRAAFTPALPQPARDPGVAAPVASSGDEAGPPHSAGSKAAGSAPPAQHPPLPRPAWTGAPARRRSLLHAAMAVTGCSVDDALRLRVAAPVSGSTWVLLGPDRSQRPIGPALQAMISQHFIDAGAPPPSAAPMPLLFALRSGVRRWLVCRAEAEVELEPWPRPSAPRLWSAAACRRSLGR